MDWPPHLGKRDEQRRAAEGLIVKGDGWYKTFGGKTRYVCKPCALAEAIVSLKAKLKLWDAATVSPIAAIVTANSVEVVGALYLAYLQKRAEGKGVKKLAMSSYGDNLSAIDLFIEACTPHTLHDEVGPEHFKAFIDMPEMQRKAPTSRNRYVICVKAFMHWSVLAGHRKLVINFGPDFGIQQVDSVVDKFRDQWEVRQALWAVHDDPLLNAAGHLGLNGGFNPKELGTMPMSAVDLRSRVIDLRRNKTGIGRVVYLLPQTVAAIETYLAVRTTPTRIDDGHLLFIGARGGPMYRDSRFELNDPADANAGTHYVNKSDVIGQLWARKVGWGHSCLRTTVATYADDWRDELAVDVLLGHKSGKAVRKTRRKHYTKRFNVNRVKQLVEHVWPLAVGRVGPLDPKRPEALWDADDDLLAS